MRDVEYEAIIFINRKSLVLRVLWVINVQKTEKVYEN